MKAFLETYGDLLAGIGIGVGVLVCLFGFLYICLLATEFGGR
jgi:hypothetical protein